jgi:hypothetical protein
MSHAIFLRPSDQLLSSATLSMATNTVAAGYALSNLYDGNPAKPLRLSAATGFDILIDFGAAVTKAIKAAYFFGHNFDPGTTIRVQGNATNSWSSPTVNLTVTVPADATDGFGQDFCWLLSTQTTALRYWRIGTAATNSSAWRLGELVITDKVDRYLPSDNMQPTLAISDLRVGAVEHRTPAGTSPRYQAPSRIVRIAGEIKGPRASLLAVRDWLRAMGGLGVPTAFILEDDDSNHECFFVVPDVGDFDLQHVAGQIWRANLSLRTLSPGVAS